MAAIKPKTVSSKSSKPSKQSGAKSSLKIKKRTSKLPNEDRKSKPSQVSHKKKQRTYTEKELGIPTLNMITPAGVQKPKGKKKGKIFVDDQESMMTILAIVNAEKEGQIESKMMKARQMEEIREARRKEAEARSEQKRSKLEEVKESVRKNKRKPKIDMPTSDESSNTPKSAQSSKKRVSFG